ncbi:MAG: hypothetical protein H0V41_07900 [Pseudonocardiales bacterium]|nr:hypothetical protein [Pseudonocardiales bacterium]
MNNDGLPPKIRPATEFGRSARASDETKLHLFVVLATGSRSRRLLDSAALAQHGVRAAPLIPSTHCERRWAGCGLTSLSSMSVSPLVAALSRSSWYGARARH